MTLLNFLIITCATLYIAEVVTHKSGPFGVFALLRRVRGVGALLSCIWCSVVWIAIGVVWVYVYLILQHTPGAIAIIVWGFAAAGAAMMLRVYTGVAHNG